MKGFNTSIIKPKKYFEGAKKVPMGKMNTIKTMMEMEDEKEDKAEKMEPKEKSSPKKAKSEDMASLEMSMAASKKSAAPKKETEFIPHNKSMLQDLQPSEPEAKKKYLEKIKLRKGM
jgi:hypothetical protein